MGNDVRHHEVRIRSPDVAYVVSRRGLRQRIADVIDMLLAVIVIPLNRTGNDTAQQHTRVRVPARVTARRIDDILHDYV